MLACYYLEIRQLHIGCVAFSGSLFALRGLMRIAGIPLAQHWTLRWTSYAVDTALLVAAVLLTLIVHQYPFMNTWLTTKVLLLVVYIALGSLALRRAQTRAGTVAALLGALLTYALIIGVAIAHHPAGWFHL